MMWWQDKGWRPGDANFTARLTGRERRNVYIGQQISEGKIKLKDIDPPWAFTRPERDQEGLPRQ